MVRLLSRRIEVECVGVGVDGMGICGVMKLYVVIRSR